jgi:heme/copper-type cytochrome/quinol oxidase subunit 2
MSFREKSAWITLITLVLAGLLWSAHLPWGRFTLAPDSDPVVFHALVLATISFVVIVVVAHVVVAIRAPREANARADEREQLIGLKATRLGAYVYAVLSMSSVFLIHLGANEIGLAYFLVVSLVTAEIVSSMARIVYHRQGV